MKDTSYKMLRFTAGRLTGASIRKMPKDFDASAYTAVTHMTLTTTENTQLPNLLPLEKTLRVLNLTGFQAEGDAFLTVPNLQQLRLVDVDVDGDLSLPSLLTTIEVAGGSWKVVRVNSSAIDLRLTNNQMQKWPLLVCKGVDQLVTLKLLDVWVEGGVGQYLQDARKLQQLEYGMFPCTLPQSCWDHVLLKAFACPRLTRVILGETSRGVCPRLLQVWAACKSNSVDNPFGLHGLRAFLVSSEKIEILVTWKR